MRIGLLLTGVLIASAGPAVAQTDELIKCARVAENDARLSCYDRAVAAMSAEARAISEKRAAETARLEAEKAAAATAAAAAAAKASEERRKTEFGSKDEHKEQQKEEIQQIEAGLQEVLTTQTGLAVFLLDNGQLWRQESAQSVPSVKPGQKVVVKRTLLGGFTLLLQGSSRAYKVIRLR